MTTHTATDYEAVLHKVSAWTAADRFSLVQDVLKTLAPREDQQAPGLALDDEARRRRGEALERLSGILAGPEPPPTDADVDRRPDWRSLRGIARSETPPPTDEEVQQWLEERRMEKYGR